MPLYIGDYLADTGHLNAQQHGSYLLMLMHQWRTGPLPNDDRRLCQIARVDLATWRRSVGPVVLEFFTASEAGFSQKRLEHERNKSDERTDKRSAAGALGATNRWQADGNANGNANGKHPKVGSQNDGPSPSPSPSKKKEGSLRSLARQKPSGSNEFDRFWAEYPRKVAKLAAQKAFLKALKIASIDAIMDGLERYEFADDHTKQPHSATWLNGGCWMVEANTPPSRVAKPKLQQSELAEFVSAMNLFGNDDEQPPVIDEYGRIVA